MPQTLAEKVAEAVLKIGDLEKKGDNGEFKWLRASDLFREVRNRLFPLGISISQTRIIEMRREQPYLTVNEDIVSEVYVAVEYKLTDGKETLLMQSAGVGQDYKGHALSIALTDSLKSLFKAIALIATTEDEVQVDGPVPAGLAEKIDEMVEKCGDDAKEWPISRRDVVAWGQACQLSKKRNSAREAFLEEMGVTKISDLKRKDFKTAMAWATNEAS